MAPISVERAVPDQLATISAPTAGTKETSPNGASSKLENYDNLVFFSPALQPGGTVSDKIKAKIWANEYVDFGILLSETPSPNHYSLSINTTTPSLGAELTLEPYRPTKKITNINQWISALNTFVAIYVVNFSSRSP